MPTDAQAALDDLLETFDLLEDWEERYRYVIDLGRELEPLADSERNASTKVSGCASQVWLVADPVQGGRMHWRGDSDAHIVRGLIAILHALYSGLTVVEVGQVDAPAALARLGLNDHLSAQRSNGLRAMVTRIRLVAAAVAA